jgi:phage protein D
VPPTAEATPIYLGEDFYVPAFEMKLDGRQTDQGVIKDVTSVTYKDNIAQFDTFDVAINNWDAENLKFKYSDTKLFDPGKRIELQMGYYGRMRMMLKGEITSLRPSFPSGGGSTLTISGQNTMYKLRTAEQSEIYENLTDSDVATKICQRLGVDIDANGQGEEKLKYLIQDNQFDIIFLMERARRIGYDIFVKERDNQKPLLTFKKSTKERRTAYSLTFGKSLIEFQPELTTNNQVGKVVVRGWDPVLKKKIEVTATRDEIETKGVGAAGGQQDIDKSFKDKAEIIATKPVESEAEGRILAKEILEGIAKDMVKGNGSTVGLPDLRAGVVLQIDGLGKRFSGRYFVTGSTHTIADGGYTTQFECRREEL